MEAISFIWLDYGILGVIALSMFIGLLRGVVRESLSLATWVLACWGSFKGAETVGSWFDGAISIPQIRWGVGCLVTFVIIMATGWIVKYVFSQVINQSPLKNLDRVLGLGFGFARGVVILAAIVFAASFTDIPHAPDWQRSLLIKHVTEVTHWLHSKLPESVRVHFAESFKTE